MHKNICGILLESIAVDDCGVTKMKQKNFSNMVLGELSGLGGEKHEQIGGAA